MISRRDLYLSQQFQSIEYSHEAAVHFSGCVLSLRRSSRICAVLNHFTPVSRVLVPPSRSKGGFTIIQQLCRGLRRAILPTGPIHAFVAELMVSSSEMQSRTYFDDFVYVLLSRNSPWHDPMLSILQFLTSSISPFALALL